MKIIILTILLLIQFNTLQAQGNKMSEIPGKVITIEQLEDMFKNMETNANWQISGDMLWGYFFTHSEPKLLESASQKLQSAGYTFVNIYLSDKEEPSDPDSFWLHVEKIETHTPETLDKRNDEFYEFAHAYGIDTYDGMEVGPVEK